MLLKNNKKPLVSIITPFLNTEMFLKDAIESVLNQTYENWELMLIDDGSTDRSTNIAKNYALLFPNKIFYLEHENHQNLGASASRNLGIKHSKGEYIAFLDSDDVYLPPKLEKQVPLLGQYPEVGMLYSASEYWYSWTGLPEDEDMDWIWNNFGVQPNTVVQPPELIATFIKKRNTIPNPVSFLVRRKAIDSIGGWENTFRYIYTDQVFLTKICLNFPVFVSSGCWDRYRQHPNSSCEFVKKNKKAFASKLNYFSWLEKYLLDNKAKINEELKYILKNLQRVNRYPALYYIYYKYNVLKRKVIGKFKPFLPKIKSFYFQVKFNYLRIGKTKYGNLRRLTPISRKFGFDRGFPIDRYYIERFVKKYSEDIRGRVLEIGDAKYTRKYGGDKVTRSDVLHVVEGNPEATMVGDLTKAQHIPSDYFDCIIFTQTLQYIYNLKGAVETLYRILKPGGVLLVTAPGISQVIKSGWGDNWYWAFTRQSVQLLFEEIFGKENINADSFGNVLTSVAFLHGISVEELTDKELNHNDAEYQLIITAHISKKVALKHH